jgi:hypothetical protein
MELKVAEYVKMRLDKHMKDTDILKALNYAPTSKGMLQRWKKKNGILLGKGRAQFLDKELTLSYIQQHGCAYTARHFNIDLQELYRWEKENRGNA